MKYRIIYEYGLYYPQYKQLWWWRNTTWPEAKYHTKEEALEDIEQHKAIFGKDAKKPEIVWEGE